jgi:hypothetical protein
MAECRIKRVVEFRFNDTQLQYFIQVEEMVL